MLINPSRPYIVGEYLRDLFFVQSQPEHIGGFNIFVFKPDVIHLGFLEVDGLVWEKALLSVDGIGKVVINISCGKEKQMYLYLSNLVIYNPNAEYREWIRV